MINLSRALPNDYQIILVGLSKKQIQALPSNIIGISRTNNVDELRQLYAVSDYFVNPTIEDNYPTTNLEATSCGTPTITYNTGGSPESARFYGYTTKFNDVDELINKITGEEGGIAINNEDISISKFVNSYLSLYDLIK